MGRGHISPLPHKLHSEDDEPVEFSTIDGGGGQESRSMCGFSIELDDQLWQ